MNIQLSHQQYIKDSNGDIVTIVCRVQAYWNNDEKVYDELFEWNPPYDKRLKELPISARNKGRNGFDEDKMKSINEADEIVNLWDKLIRETSDYSNHYMQASVKVQEEPQGTPQIKITN